MPGHLDHPGWLAVTKVVKRSDQSHRTCSSRHFWTAATSSTQLKQLSRFR